MSKPDYDKLPTPDLRGSLEAYIEHGYMPGHFLTAVLSNDLFDAVGRADSYNLSLIPNIVIWIWNEAPSACHGSREKVRTWHEKFWPKQPDDETIARVMGKVGRLDKPGNRLDDGSNEEIADREDFDYHELNP